MNRRKAQDEQGVCTKRNAQRRLNASWWFEWVQEQLEWQDALSFLRWRGKAPRVKGLPLREYAASEVEALGGDRDRARRYASVGRRLEKVLPASLRPLVALLVADYVGVLDVEIRGSRALTPEDAERLKRICIRSMRPDEAVSRADRIWRDRKLASIDPTTVTVSKSGIPIDVATTIAVCPTSLSAGSVIFGASCAGFLPVGPIGLTIGGHAAIRPLFVFSKTPL